METGPIFIGGLANSGKTELRQLLETHPNLCLTRRTYMWTRYYMRFGDLSIAGNLDLCLAEMLQNKHIRALEPEVERIRREFAQGEATYARLFSLFHSHHAERMGKPRWGDQLGAVERFADPIFAGYPTARMIQMIRNPQHVYEETKARSRQRPGKAGWTLAHWLESVQIARRNQERYPEHYRIVRYECLMAHPAETVQEICAFIGEDFVPEMASAGVVGDIAGAPQETNGSAPSARPLLPARARREAAFMQAYAGAEMAVLGYSSTPGALSIRDRLLFCLLDWPANRAGMVAWQAKNG